MNKKILAARFVMGAVASNAGFLAHAAQHYPYIRRQIEDAAQLHQELAPPAMTSALRGMNSREKDAVADYISRLGNSNVLLDSNRSSSPNQ